MRISDLFESAPGKKGRTTQEDVRIWLDRINSGEADEKDVTLFNQLKAISKKLGGKTTVIEVLKAMD